MSIAVIKRLRYLKYAIVFSGCKYTWKAVATLARSYFSVRHFCFLLDPCVQIAVMGWRLFIVADVKNMEAGVRLVKLLHNNYPVSHV